jgi:N-acetyl-gamma-glutamylphosphate reductase
MKRHVGIVGFRGYSGAELVRILERHPHVTPVLVEHRADPDAPPFGWRPHPRIACTPEAVAAEGLAAVFLATPAEVSMELAPGMLAAGAKVIDLSGAFRLRTPEVYVRWYKEPHTAPALLAETAYGLPEFWQPRLLSDAGELGNPSPDRGWHGGSDGGPGLRCQVRRQRRRPQADPENEFLRDLREFLGLFNLRSQTYSGNSTEFRFG